MRRVLLLGGILFAFALASGCLSGPLVGKPVPSFELVDSDGRLVNETSFLGRYLVLDLMATWCGPCKLEVAHLREVKALHGDKVEILSIGVDPDEGIEDLERFGAEHGADWPYAIDRSGDVYRAMQMRIIPKLIVVDPEGVVVFEREGEVLPAAITRAIDPTASAPGQPPILAALAGLGLGFLAAFNPYRALHRESPGRAASLAALVILALLVAAAWPLAGLVSTRATLGSLAIGAMSLGGAFWWFRARRKAHDAKEARWWAAAGDRAYEMGAPFAAALVLGLSGSGAAGFFAPLVGFLVGASGGLATRERLQPNQRDALGLAGLALAGIGLLIFGARILLVR